MSSNYKSWVQFSVCPLYGKTVPHFSMVSKVLYQNFPSPNFALPKYAFTNFPPPPPPGTVDRVVLYIFGPRPLSCFAV